MAEIVVLGAGLGGVIMAYELRELLGDAHRVTVVTKEPVYHFVPSNPWVGVGWSERKSIEVGLAPVFARRGITLMPQAATRVEPTENRVQLADGSLVNYDYLVIATGPDLAFDEIEGFGPGGHTQSICHVDHAEQAAKAFERLCAEPGPIITGAVQGASCYGPAYEYTFILDTALRRKKLRDQVPMTFVTSEPYIGHLGLDGVGDTKSLLESQMRQHHIKWICNARVASVAKDVAVVEEINDDGTVKARHELPQKFMMMLPAFRGVSPLRDVPGLVNPRGFVLIDKHQANPTFPNVYAVGVCVAIPPMGKTAVPCGVPKTGFMIESMVTAAAKNIALALKGEAPKHQASWNAVCLADFGDGGVAFVAQPQIPPRNVNWSSSGKWVHAAKIGFEKYFMHKLRRGTSEPFYEKLALDLLGIGKLKETK
jgi:sulfide:quinone oxidoreductase